MSAANFTAGFAADFIRTPKDLSELQTNIARILEIVGEEWSTDHAAQDGENASRHSYSGATPEELRVWLKDTLGEILADAPGESAGARERNPTDEEWRSELLRGVVRHSIQLRHSATAAHLHCLPFREAVAAEVLIALLNQSMDSFDQSGVATLIESHMIDWLGRECFGIHATQPAGSAGVFTSGGTQSNLMGLLLAREAAVQRLFGISAFQCGLPAEAGRLRILCQEHAHFSASQAAGLLGLGRDAIVPIPVHARDGGVNLQVAREVHAQLIRDGLLPFVFFATAGTTDRGAIDDLQQVGSFCRERDLWFHVDAAYGGALLMTRHRDRLRGVELADSLTVDFHKLFFQPIACGAFLARDARSFASMRQHADYLNRESDAFPNLVDRSLATTRRFDALKLLLSMKGVGRDRFEAMIDRLLEMTAYVRTIVADHPTLELVAEPALTTVLFRVTGSDGLNSAVRDRLLASGAAVIGESRLNGRVVLKLTLMNPTAGDAELSELLELVARTASELDTNSKPESKIQTQPAQTTEILK
ncbi:MAG: pyridoxal-dependent decarboxylase [bacterium]|nr:pyridoxal-dependent decarboxylase [bacterium]